MDEFTPPPTPEVFTGNDLVARLIELKEEKIALNDTIKKLEIKNKKLEEHNAILRGAINNITSIGKDVLNDHSDSMANYKPTQLEETNFMVSDNPTQLEDMNVIANDNPTQLEDMNVIANDNPTQQEDMNFMANDNPTQLEDMNFMALDEPIQLGEINFMPNDKGELVQVGGVNFMETNNNEMMAYENILKESAPCYCTDQRGIANHSCGGFCPKVLSCGMHCCSLSCHYGECGECQTCSRLCGKGLKCGKHRCEQPMCQNPDHNCNLTCENILNCGAHACGQPCHWGDCSSCTLCSTFRVDPVECPKDHQFVCHICTKTFKTKSALNIHKSVHRKNTEISQNFKKQNIPENIQKKMPAVRDPNFVEKFQNFFTNMEKKSKDSKRNLLTKLRNEAFIEIIRSDCSCDITITMR